MDTEIQRLNRLKDSPKQVLTDFGIYFTYHSQKIEGSKMTLQETDNLILKGIKPEGKKDSAIESKAHYDLFKKLKWCIVGTFIIKTKNEKWVGDMPPGLYLPPRTTNFNYVRIHGKNRWKGELSKKQLELIKTKLKNQNTNISFIMFNNSFFDNKNKTCKINKIKIKSAAICNAAQFSNI